MMGNISSLTPVVMNTRRCFIRSDLLTSLHVCLWTSQDSKLRFGWRRERASNFGDMTDPMKTGSRFQTNLRSRFESSWVEFSSYLHQRSDACFLAVTMCRWPSLLGCSHCCLRWQVSAFESRVQSTSYPCVRFERNLPWILQTNLSEAIYDRTVPPLPCPSSFLHKTFNVKR